MSTAPSMRGQDWVLLIALSVVWGGSFLFNGLAVRELPVVTIVACRVLIAALLLVAGLRLSGGHLPRDRGFWRTMLLVAFLNSALPFSLIVGAQRHLTSGEASILNASVPLFTIVLAHLLTRDERMTPGKLGGVLLGFAGVAVMIGPEALSHGSGNLGAQAMSLGAAASYGLAAIAARRLVVGRVAPTVAAASQMVGASLMLVPLAVIVDQPWTLAMPSASTIGAVVALGALSTALAYIIFFRLIASAGAVNAGAVTLLVPVSAVLLGWLVLDEQLAWREFGGMALIALGLVTIDGRAWGALRRL